MSTFALIADGLVYSLVPATVDIDGMTYAMADRFHPDVVAHAVELSPAQAQDVEVGWMYAGGVFSAPPIQQPDPPKTYVRRIHIFERATPGECVDLAGRLAAADDQLAQIFSAADWIDHENPWYPSLRAEIVSAVGEERAGVLLAPSPYP